MNLQRYAAALLLNRAAEAYRKYASVAPLRQALYIQEPTAPHDEAW